MERGAELRENSRNNQLNGGRRQEPAGWRMRLSDCWGWRVQGRLNFVPAELRETNWEIPRERPKMRPDDSWL